MPKCDAVFEGGGVKGIGLVGAVAVTESLGYEFVNVAGTSAGAIVAAMIAAGYTAAELRAIMADLDYSKFKDKGLVERIPVLGEALSLGFEKGIYEGDFLEQWLGEKLARKGKRTFADLVIPQYASSPRYRYRLKVVASDVSRGRLLTPPDDIEPYGVEPDRLEIARAVRMSMSIPFFYEPVKLTLARTGETCYIVDGGLLSNFPVEMFDDGSEDPQWPTFGYLLAEDPDFAGERVHHEINGPISLLAALFSTMLEAHDRVYISNGAFARTIPIPTVGVGTTEFNLSRDRADKLYQSGQDAARAFFARWDFERYKQEFRERAARSRRESLYA